MAAQGAIKNWFTFVNGLNTEGGYFVTPPEAWKEGNNVIPSIDGSISRRNGIDIEENAATSVTRMPRHFKPEWAYATSQWKAFPEDAVPDERYNFLVVQYGPRIAIFNNDNLTTSSEILFQFTLTNYPADFFQAEEIYNKDKIGKEPCSFSVVNGQLIVVSNVTIPVRVEFNTSPNNTFTITPFSLSIRDFEGIDTFGLSTSVEKTQAEWNTYYSDLGVSDGYYRALYNLYNQGWTDSQINPYKTANGNKLPANSKMWIYGKDASDNFDPALLNKQDFGSINAAKGRTILDLFYQERKATLTFTTQYDYRPTQVAFFAGRAWYAGLQGTMSGRVLFSQVLDNTSKLGNCYQANDPTSEVASDVLDSDGGIIEIPEAGQIKKLVAVGKGLLVFATNGVYNISGIDTVFSANNYQVEKITNVGCIASNSVVIVESNVIYWATDGIYVISNVGLEYKVDNMSDKTIKTLYNKIPFSGKQYVTGVYNPSTTEVMWLYNSFSLENENDNVYANDSILVFNKTLTCFYTHSFEPKFDGTDSEYYVASVFLTSTEPALVIDETVTNNDLENVVDSTDDVVTASVSDNKYYNQQFKFLYVVPYIDEDYQLWTTIPASDFASGGPYVPTLASRTFPAYTPIDSEDERDNVMQFKRVGEDIFFALVCTLPIWVSQVRTSTLCVYNKLTGTAQQIELGYDCVSTLLPAGYGAMSVVFNRDGTRLYVSALNPTINQVNFGYFSLSTGYDLSTIGSFVVMDSYPSGLYLVGDQLLHTDMEFTDDEFGNSYLNTMRAYTNYSVSPNANVLLMTIPLTSAEAVNYNISSIISPPRAVSRAILKDYFQDRYSNFSFITKSKGEFVYLYRTAAYQAADSETNAQDFRVIQLQNNYQLGRPYLNEEGNVSSERIGSTPYYVLSFGVQENPWEDYLSDNLLKNPQNGNYYANNMWNFVVAYVTSGWQIRWNVFAHSLPEAPGNEQNWSNISNLGFSVSFADFLNTRDASTKYRDFNLTETPAYVVTGYELGDVGPARNKTGMYLSTFIKRTETGVDDVGELINPGSVQMSLQWDFTDQYSTNKWSTPVEVYRQPRAYIIPSFPTTFDDGYPLVVSKSKMRGRGKAVQFKFESKAGHDFNIVGWTGTFVGSTNV